MAAFEEKWQLLLHQLTPNTSIRNWTANKGYLGDSMEVVNVNRDEVVVRAPKAKNLQHISRDEFEKIWKIWPDYKAGQVQRQEIREMTFYSKYIISILHWLEEIK